jgi:FkbM family methyltransferase
MNYLIQLKFLIQRILRRFGWEVRRFAMEEEAQLVRLLELQNIDTVLDVGANIGQFAMGIRQAGFKGKIISFEPQSAAYSKLAALAASLENWQIAPRCAVGACIGKTEINLSQNSVSSSILEIDATHTSSAPASSYEGKESVEVITLDTSKDVPPAGKLFLKVDTQGFEMPVLQGADKLLSRLMGVQLETSLTELYKGQATFIELISFMESRNFRIWSINPGFSNRETGQLLQADVTFVRRGH